jgi:hypothetical protein
MVAMLQDVSFAGVGRQSPTSESEWEGMARVNPVQFGLFVAEIDKDFRIPTHQCQVLWQSVRRLAYPPIARGRPTRVGPPGIRDLSRCMAIVYACYEDFDERAEAR